MHFLKKGQKFRAWVPPHRPQNINGVVSVCVGHWLLIVELDLQFRLSRVEPDEAQGLAELPVGHHSVTVAVKPEQKLRVKMQFSGNVSY